MDMCRFESRDNAGYKRVVAAIKFQVVALNTPSIHGTAIATLARVHTDLQTRSQVVNEEEPKRAKDDAAATRVISERLKKIQEKEAYEKAQFMECIKEWNVDKQWLEVAEAHPGTVDWLFESLQYKAWETATKASVFCLQGPPGWGKSVIGKFVSNQWQLKV